MVLTFVCRSLACFIVGGSSASVGIGVLAIGNPFAVGIPVTIQASILGVTAIHFRAISNTHRAIRDSFGSLVAECFPLLVIAISFVNTGLYL